MPPLRRTVRTLLGLLLTGALLGSLTVPGVAQAAAPPPVLAFKPGVASRWLYGTAYPMDTAPAIAYGRTLLPVRYVAEPLGATVAWDGSERRVDIRRGERLIQVWVDQHTARVDGVAAAIDANPQVAPRIAGGRALVPARFIAEALGATVGWNPADSQVTVDASPTPAFANPNFQRGMSYAVYGADLLNRSTSDALLRQLPAQGVKWVALIPVWYQDTYRSTRIYPGLYDSATDASVLHAIDLLHSLGIKVMLKPFVDSYDSTWRAKFEPTDWGVWFDQYTAFITHFSQLAEQAGVEEFCIGTEYDSSIPAQNDRWRSVIGAVRTTYRGPLTYAANYTDYQQVDFWDDLNYIGIDAYFPLSQLERPDLPTLKAGWQQAVSEMDGWRRRTGMAKPMIFTELGFPSYNASTRSPGDWTLGSYPDPALQADAYEATFEVLADKPWLAGLYWWWWDNPTTADYQGAKHEMGYTPRGKLAGGVLAQWYQR